MTLSDRHSLLRILAIAVEDRLPVPPLLRAYAEDLTGKQQERVRRMAELMEEGKSLPAAMEQVTIVEKEVIRLLPDRDVLAIRCGAQSGTLPKTLRKLVNDSQSIDKPLYREASEVLMGVTMIGLFTCGLLTFLAVTIWPTYRDIFADFGAEMPAAFDRVSVAGNFLAQYGWVLVLGVIVAWSLLWTSRRRSFRLGIWERWMQTWSKSRSGELLEQLSLIAREGRPIPGALSTLARYHHDPRLRQKLLFVRNEVEQGADVWESLTAVKLLTPRELAVLEAAGQAGNRPWAMEQLARAKQRVIQSRLNWLRESFTPIGAVLLGGIVLSIALAVFSPLMGMIGILSNVQH